MKEVLGHMIMATLYVFAMGTALWRRYETGIAPPPMTEFEACALITILAVWWILAFKSATRRYRPISG